MLKDIEGGCGQIVFHINVYYFSLENVPQLSYEHMSQQVT